jgi:hypothetical protein
VVSGVDCLAGGDDITLPLTDAVSDHDAVTYGIGDENVLSFADPVNV